MPCSQSYRSGCLAEWKIKAVSLKVPTKLKILRKTLVFLWSDLLCKTLGTYKHSFCMLCIEILEILQKKTPIKAHGVLHARCGALLTFWKTNLDLGRCDTCYIGSTSDLCGSYHLDPCLFEEVGGFSMRPAHPSW